ncbi:MAG: SPFH domain-containing protein [Lachnospiraceae bacterium]|nr:SPFH domain-containing protein [Lachnospiraceae bacterium]
MGLIAAAMNAAGNQMSNQWREFFYQDAIPNDVLMVAGKHQTGRTSNTKGEDNVITNGSTIAVADGQCMIIIQQGKVTDISVEPGEYTFRTDLAPTFFVKQENEGFWQNVKRNFGQMMTNFTYGGNTAVVQKVYFINTKLILDRPFGTQTPIYFNVKDSRLNFESDVELRIHGKYDVKVVDPIMFYTNIAANVAYDYKLSQIEGALKSDISDKLQDAIGGINQDGLRPSGLPAKKKEITALLREELRWEDRYGLQLMDIRMEQPKMSKEDEDTLKELQKAYAMGGNAAVAAGMALNAQNQAMVTAAGNSAGAMTGFLGMNMASQAGMANTNGLFQMAQQQMAQQQPVQQAPQQMAPQAAAPAANAAVAGWKCPKCGKADNTGKFCGDCGEPRPAAAEGWTCSCGAVNKGKFCAECGQPKPAGAPLYKCDKCGWEPEDPHNPPKFCPECGDPFTDNDKV